MPARWTSKEEIERRRELSRLYVKENKTIGEIGNTLGIGESTVYDRLIRLGIPTLRSQKIRYNNTRNDIRIPEYSADLAEFIGIMLGDGHLTPTQVTITLGKKDEYVDHVTHLIRRIFGITPRVIVSSKRDTVVYFGSAKIVRWLLEMGLAFNKVKAQVDIPRWVFSKKEYIVRTLRGLYDTDGSIYRLRFGVQLSITNRSIPLLRSTRNMLCEFKYSPSRLSKGRIYLTRVEDLTRFYKEIGFGNRKHIRRYQEIMRR